MRVAYGRLLQSRSETNRQEYRSVNLAVKRGIRQYKNRTEEEWRRSLESNFRENKNIFWREVNKVRKDKQDMSGLLRM